MGRGNLEGKGRPLWSIGTSGCELCKNSWTDRDAESGGPKEPHFWWRYRSPWEETILRGKGMPWHARRHSDVNCAKPMPGDADVNCAKTAELIQMPCGLWTQVGPRKHALDGSQIPCVKRQLLGERTCPGITDNTLLWAEQRWLNQSICRLGYGLGWAAGSTGSIVFARWHQCAITGRRISTTWWIRTIHLWWQCGLTSNFFDHLLLLLTIGASRTDLERSHMVCY